jgi:hypothetical protein
MLLSHSQARAIAEATWGRGGTHSYGTNTAGAFYFSCSGHGGFVISLDSLTNEELVEISPYINIEEGTLYRWGRRTRFMHPYRTSGFKISFDATIDKVKFFLLEEDCDWALAYVFTGIRHKTDPVTPIRAQESFERYHVKEQRA